MRRETSDKRHETASLLDTGLETLSHVPKRGASRAAPCPLSHVEKRDASRAVPCPMSHVEKRGASRALGERGECLHLEHGASLLDVAFDLGDESVG